MLKLPSEIWLAGKGPSLDTYDWSQANSIKIGINEAILKIPNGWGVFAVDYMVWECLTKEMSKNILAFIKNKTYAVQFPLEYRWKIEDSKPGFGTAAHAIMILSTLGVEKIHFVGFDSFNGGSHKYAQSLQDRPFRNNDKYAAMNRYIREALRLTKIEAVWEC